MPRTTNSFAACCQARHELLVISDADNARPTGLPAVCRRALSLIPPSGDYIFVSRHDGPQSLVRTRLRT